MTPLVQHRRFDIDDYTRMVQAGILTEQDRVELIDGEVVEMHAIGPRHVACTIELTHLFGKALGDEFRVHVQGPVQLPPYSMPEPDVTVVSAREGGYAAALPGWQDALLLIEVADSSLAYDRNVKVPLYARAGVPEVWVVDLTTDAVEVYRGPQEGEYRERSRLSEGAIRPSAFPDLEVRLEDFLPARPEGR